MTPLIVMIPLAYGMGDLAPAISQQTMEFHYGKHYQNYVNMTNKLVVGTEFEAMPLPDIVRHVKRGPLRNNAGQAYNHELYFTQFKAYPDRKAPNGALGRAIKEAFGSFDAFKQEFADSVTSLFGSGWTWLQSDSNGRLSIVNYPNGENPLMENKIPLLGIDCWEHAYYLDYQNKRIDHMTAVWTIIDWSVIEQRFGEL